MMVLVIGGAHQGKAALAKRLYPALEQVHGLHRLARRAFGGITGDLAGFFISTSELLALCCAAAGGMLL